MNELGMDRELQTVKDVYLSCTCEKWEHMILIAAFHFEIRLMNLLYGGIKLMDR